jgi:hypothetical protein
MPEIAFKIKCTESFVLDNPTISSLRSHIRACWGEIEPDLWYINSQGDRIKVENDHDLQGAIELEADLLNGGVSLKAHIKKSDAQLQNLREEMSRLREEHKCTLVQAQEKFDAAACVLKRENESLKQKLASADSVREQTAAAAAATTAGSAQLQGEKMHPEHGPKLTEVAETQPETRQVGRTRSKSARNVLTTIFKLYSIPENLGVTLTIAFAALVAACTAGTAAAFALVGILLFLLQAESPQGKLSIVNCFWLALLPVVAHAATGYLFQSLITSIATLFCSLLCVVAYPRKFPFPITASL